MYKKIVYLISFLALFLVGLPVLAEGNTVSVNLPNYGPDNFSAFLTTILTEIGGIIGALGTVMFIISGIMYIGSTANPDLRNTAKKALLYAIIGMFVGFSAQAIINFVKGFVQ